MNLNILKVWIDRAGRITESVNLSLNQCSNNNQFRVYYTDEVFTNLEISFRKPDGWLSDKLTLSHAIEVDDEGFPTGNKYAYVDIPQSFSDFILGGRNGILVANLYFHLKDQEGNIKVATIGNIRINVNYVDDANVHTDYSEAYINSINAHLTKLDNDIYDISSGSTLAGRAVSDKKGNIIDTTYETKYDATVKFTTLEEKKLDKTELKDQTTRLENLETNNVITNSRLKTIEDDINTTESNISKNANDISDLNKITVKYDEYEKHIQDRIAAEAYLQQQIDGVSLSSNFKDMVDTFAKLQSYDKSKLSDGDRIQVLSDSNYQGAATIWRYNASTNSFEYVGLAAAPSFTKEETKAELAKLEKTVPNKLYVDNNTMVLNRDGTTITGQTPIQFKTINNQSIFGSGNIAGITVDSEFSATSTNPVQNKTITNSLATKANKRDVENSLKSKADKTEVEKKQDKLTAGAGITITENGVISSSAGLSIEKVDTLPETGISGVIYLVPVSESSYTEYIWIQSENRYELLGSTEISLDNYYSISEIDAKLSEKASTAITDILAASISANTVAIAGKADRQSFTNLSTAISALTEVVDEKADAKTLNETKTELSQSLDTKQEKLVSGENIKSVGGNTLLGYGDIPFKTINNINIIGEGNISVTSDGVIDLSEYYKKNETDALFNDYYDRNQVDDFLENKVNKVDMPDLSVYSLKTDLQSTAELLTDRFDEIYTKNEINSNFYNKTEVNDLIQDADINIDLSDYYTKEEVDNAITSHTPTLTGYATESWVEGKGYLTSLEAASKYVLSSSIPDDVASRQYVNEAVAAVDVSNQLKDYAKTEYVDRKVSDLVNSAPETLDTLSEIATALENNTNTIDVLNEAIGSKQNKLVAGSNIEIIGNTISAVIDVTTEDLNLNLAEYAKKTYVDSAVSSKVADLVGAAPAELDTLYEISSAIQNNKGTIESLQSVATSKQDKLVSGTNIKTINNQSILGSGNIKVAGSFNDLTDKDNVIINATVSDNTLTLRNVANQTVTFKGTTDYTKLTNTPTKLSQFTNDGNFISSTDVDTKISTEIAKVIAGADSSYDTLKEIADYIASDKTGAATLATDISNNAKEIASLNTKQTALEGRVKTNEDNITALITSNTSILDTIPVLQENVNTNTNNITGLTTRVGDLEAIDHDGMLSDISDLKSNISVHTGNIKDINNAISSINQTDSTQNNDINNIKNVIGSFSGTLEDFYTKDIADEKFLDYGETISKSESVVDYNSKKQIRFTTDLENSDLTITKADFTDITNLLSMMVPNEY